ncbi:MAG: amino acid ABC transporter permease [Segniliparus sp.]|uniref:amino acid ABC transporter permease n=1 Tax=Segniliparus sp. TaxID=2804064 RepID=UPI003F2DD27B
MTTAAPARALPAAKATTGTALAGADLAGIRTVPRRHPMRWVLAAGALVLFAQFAHGLIVNPGWDWPTFAKYFTATSIAHALWTTVRLTAWGTALGFLLGGLLAAARLSANPVLGVLAWGYVWLFRSIPLIVQILFWFNISYLYNSVGFGVPFGPALFHVDVNSTINGTTAAVVALSLHQAAYAAEIIRGGIAAVDAGQREAAEALGVPRVQQTLRIVLPQAMRGILPNAVNEIVNLFKGTSIVSVVAISELFYQVQIIYGRNGRVVPLLMVATVWYLVLTTLLTIAQHYVERHFARSVGRASPASPWQKARDRWAGLVRAARA